MRANNSYLVSPSKFSRVISVYGALAIGVLAVGQMLSPLPLTANDQYLLWLVNNKRDYFVRSNVGQDISKPKLMVLDEKIKQQFTVVKGKDVFRIFCVGGSTTVGWPFEDRGSYPLFLSRILHDALPTRHIEVINAGFAASDSSSDVDLVAELADYQPDLLILYEGRNEAWNLPLHVGWRSRALKIHAWLFQNIRLYDRARRRLQTENRFDSAAAVRRWAERSSREVFPELESLFQNNVARMIDAMARRHCPVLLLTQIVSPEEDTRYPKINKINGWIRELAKTKAVPLVDLDADFRNHPNDADRLIIPFPVTHPDLAGYELMARLIAHQLPGLIRTQHASDWRWNRVRSDAEYARLLKADDPAYLADVYGRLAEYFTDSNAHRYLTRADLLRKTHSAHTPQ